MWAFKFVTSDFESPGRYGKIHYKFNEPAVELYPSPAYDGQCAKGIHVIPEGNEDSMELYYSLMLWYEVHYQA